MPLEAMTTLFQGIFLSIQKHSGNPLLNGRRFRIKYWPPSAKMMISFHSLEVLQDIGQMFFDFVEL